jgi:hypothetical protein
MQQYLTGDPTHQQTSVLAQRDLLPNVKQSPDSNNTLAIALLEQSRPSVENARTNALLRVMKIVKIQSDSQQVIGSLKAKLLQVSERYDQAYQRFEKIIAAAGKEAQDQQDYTDMVVGIAIGVAVGLCAEVLAGWAVAEAVGEVAAVGLKKWGKAAGKEAMGEGAETIVGQLAKPKLDVPGKDLQPDGLKPEVLNMEIWRSLTQLHEAASRGGKFILDQTILSGAAEYAIGEIKSQRGGGADMTVDDDVDIVLSVLRAEEASKNLDQALDTLNHSVATLESGVSKLIDYGIDQMEKDIWILWMSNRKENSNILDIDAIEDHLTALGIVDFGWYTTDAEENEAIENAKERSAEVRNRRYAAMRAGSANPDLRYRP